MGGQQTRPTTLVTEGPIQVPDESFQIFNNIQDSPVDQTPDVPFNHSDTMDEKFRKVCHEWRRKIDSLTERVAQIEKDVAQTHRAITTRLDALNQDCVRLNLMDQSLNMRVNELIADVEIIKTAKQQTSGDIDFRSRFNRLYGTIGAQTSQITSLKDRMDELETAIKESASNAHYAPIEVKSYHETHIASQTVVNRLKN